MDSKALREATDLTDTKQQAQTKAGKFAAVGFRPLSRRPSTQVVLSNKKGGPFVVAVKPDALNGSVAG